MLGETRLADVSNNRSQSRSNVFLTATLDTGGAATPVRIRNLSSKGALVEAASLPPVGSRLRLLRGELQVNGEVAWAGAGQGGITFTGTIDVDRWVKRAGHSGQQRVDGMVASLRGMGEAPSAAPAAPDLATVVAVSCALDQLCESLAATPEMSIQLGENLLKLDSIAQALRRIATGKAF